MGVKCLGSHDDRLLAKWNWCFATENGDLLNEVIRIKFRVQEGGCAPMKLERVMGYRSGMQYINDGLLTLVDPNLWWKMGGA